MKTGRTITRAHVFVTLESAMAYVHSTAKSGHGVSLPYVTRGGYGVVATLML